MSWKKAKLKAKKSKLNKYHTFNPDSNGGKEWRERQKNKPRNSTATQKKKKNSNWKNTAKTDITTLKFEFHDFFKCKIVRN